jgi:hypothetical protein
LKSKFASKISDIKHSLLRLQVEFAEQNSQQTNDSLLTICKLLADVEASLEIPVKKDYSPD